MNDISMNGFSVPAIMSVMALRSTSPSFRLVISWSATPMNRGMVAGAIELMLMETSPNLKE